MTIKKKVYYADNGIMIKDHASRFCDVVEYRKQQDCSYDTTPAKAAIGGEIFDIALDCMAEGLPEGEELIGFNMEVILTPIIQTGNA